ncbi:MAG: iron-sulfur cluster assembly scaffold protein [Deltaproteobacteria bacterium]|nr:iron-sulfur cluster assembly scaffold protein [Deltaproteobacteria bacterium]MBW2070863.1 iron-sulfur cluster assembly scaffold protein [Deltaproteobacteria bacterium]
MSGSLDEFAEHLQQEIIAQAKKTYGAAAVERWLHPSHLGKIENASSFARLKGSCGDTMEMYLQIRDDHILEARCYTDGCASSMICGSVAAELATGKDLDEAAQIAADTILAVLEGMPAEERHCASLAAETLQAAIHNWMIKNVAHQKRH